MDTAETTKSGIWFNSTQRRIVGAHAADFDLAIRWRGGRTGHRVVAVALGTAMLATLSGCQHKATEAMPDVARLSSSKKVTCDFDGVDELAAEPTCYEVSVPEDWSQPDNKDRVVLPVAVFSATNGKGAKADPMIFFQGGPGGRVLDDLGGWEAQLVTPFEADRDVIMYDQRGTGRAQPSLGCQEGDAVDLASMKGEVDDDEYPEAALKATQQCYDRLSAAGVDLAAYNSISSSHDVEAIRLALGYKQLNLLGISYGTRLAQTYMRLYPKSIRAAIIDSVYPVANALDETAPKTGAAALQHLFSACADDPACAETYPNFEEDYFALLDRLDIEPAKVELTDPEGDSFASEITGDDLVGLTFDAMYSKIYFSAIPQMVAEANSGDYALMTRLMNSLAFDDGFSSGMHYSVQCHEEVPFEPTQEASTASSGDDGYNRFAVLGESPSMAETCQIWKAGKADGIENRPVSTEIPTLVLSGSFDPITPPSDAQSVAEHLKHAYVFEFPTEGHSVTTTQCGADMGVAFLRNPDKAPDSSCIDEVAKPSFVSAPQEVVLVPFTITDPIAVSGLRPQGWEDQGQYFIRGGSLADEAALGVDAPAGKSTDEILATIPGLTRIAPTTVNGQEWETLEAEQEGSAVRLLLSPGNELEVLVAGSSDEIDELVATVAIPVAASLKTP